MGLQMDKVKTTTNYQEQQREVIPSQVGVAQMVHHSKWRKEILIIPETTATTELAEVGTQELGKDHLWTITVGKAPTGGAWQQI